MAFHPSNTYITYLYLRCSNQLCAVCVCVHVCLVYIHIFQAIIRQMAIEKQFWFLLHQEFRRFFHHSFVFFSSMECLVSCLIHRTTVQNKQSTMKISGCRHWNDGKLQIIFAAHTRKAREKEKRSKRKQHRCHRQIIINSLKLTRSIFLHI